MKNLLPDRIVKKIAISAETGCWEWQGNIDRLGYSSVWMNGGMKIGHRVVYAAINGEIHPGLTLDHLCRNRKCVNPDHLEPVTLQENVLRGSSFAAKNAAKTHCPNGHPLLGENLVKNRRERRCLKCYLEQHRLAQRRYMQRKRGL